MEPASSMDRVQKVTTSHAGSEALNAADEALGEAETKRLRRYTQGVSAVMILACNAVFLLGLWGSGVNLDTLWRTPDVFNPDKDICLRQSWHKVSGVEKPVRLCYEWINTADRSGKTHTFQQDTAIEKGADGRLYFDHGPRVDYRLFLLGAFVAVIVAGGIVAQRQLIARYRKQLKYHH
jgi:hypothetical protein